jgi:hypothetical protein
MDVTLLEVQNEHFDSFYTTLLHSHVNMITGFGALAYAEAC